MRDPEQRDLTHGGPGAPGIVCDRRRMGHSPMFSVMVAMFNVQATLGDTLSSFDAQQIAAEMIEFVIVDDGSDDESLQMALSWAAERSNVVVLHQANRGIAAARNCALRNARGRWITSVDPDDVVGPAYFQEVHALLQADLDDSIALASTRVLITRHETGRFGTNHPLDRKFRRGNRVVELASEPNAFAIGATTFLRRSVLTAHGLEFDERVSPAFEDGNLILRYLCHFDRPTVGIVASAHYFYRKVEGGSSAVQSGWAKREKYSEQVRWGYLGALRYASGIRGETPTWMALAICYDLLYYLKEFHRFNSVSRWLPSELGADFMTLCREIFSYISEEQLGSLEVNPPGPDLFQAMCIGFNLGTARVRFRVLKEDPNGWVRLAIYQRPGDEAPQTWVDNVPLAVRPDGIKHHSYYGVPLAVETVLTVPAGQISVDGSAARAEAPQPSIPTAPTKYSSQPVPDALDLGAVTERAQMQARQWTRARRIQERVWVESLILDRPRPAVLFEKALRALHSLRRRLIQADARQKQKVLGLRDAMVASAAHTSWVFMDHPERADDNAEHLYRHVRKHHPEIRATFLLNRDSCDWERLSAEGFHLLPYGGTESMSAALAADVVLSSDATEPCMYPAPRRIYGMPRAQFVFLQHGVLINDISSWLRGKRIALTICSTEDEYRAFAWKDSSYELLSSELVLSGLPRFDALLEAAKSRAVSAVQKPRRLFIMPTWRLNLSRAFANASSEAEKQRIFRESAFQEAWWQVLQHPMIAHEIHEGRLEIDFLLHPNLPPMLLTGLDVDGVNFVQPGTASFQELLVGCDFFLTDYSSLAFDASYIERPVGYFQFDRSNLRTGEHSWVPGYFDYDSMGLGPVLGAADEVARWVSQTASGRPETPEIYAARARTTFAHMDSNNSARVVAAVLNLLEGNVQGNESGELESVLPPFPKADKG